MTAERREKATGALFKLNQWLTPLVFACIIPWAVWVSKNLISLTEWKMQGDRFTQADGLRLQAEFERKFSELPPPEWKARIIATENAIGASAVQMARIETMLSDIRERMIRWEAERNDDTK